MNPPIRVRRSAFRLDVEALYVRLDKRRREHRLSWRDIAAETGVSASTFSRIAHGDGPGSDALVTLMAWLDLTDITELTTTRQEAPQ